MRKLYIVVICESYLRDTQCVIFPDDPTIMEPNTEDDANWTDFSAPGFAGCTYAETPEEACKLIAEDNYYDVRMLCAFEAPTETA